MAWRSKYSGDVRERAVALVFEHQEEYETQWDAIKSVAAKLNVCRPKL
jgi:transposase